jgi:hypothetical protein
MRISTRRRATTAALLLALSLAPAIPAAERAVPEPSLLGMTRRSGRSEKPAAPVRIVISPGATVGPGRQRAQVVTTSLVAGAGLTVRIAGQGGLSIESAGLHPPIAGSAPAALTFTPGVTTLVTSAEAGAPAAIDLVLGAGPKGGGRLLVEATLLLSDGTRQTAIALWGTEPPATSATERHPGSRVVTTPDGRQILEIPSGRP